MVLGFEGNMAPWKDLCSLARARVDFLCRRQMKAQVTKKQENEKKIGIYLIWLVGYYFCITWTIHYNEWRWILHLQFLNFHLFHFISIHSLKWHYKMLNHIVKILIFLDKVVHYSIMILSFNQIIINYKNFNNCFLNNWKNKWSQ